jgi:protein-tyrosine phosphatase
LLFEIDDGARSLDESLAMARALVALGFVAAAPSPHNRPEYASRERALAQLEVVRAALHAQQIPLQLEVNAENFFLDEGLLSTLGTPACRRTGSQGRCLLVEAPYTTPLPALTDVIFRMKLKGITALIAHPERCLEFEKKGRAAEAVQAGALLQLDVGALIGRYGPTARKLARSFLDEGLYAIAATDLHSPVGALEWVAEAMAALEKHGGKGALERLMARHPAALLRGETL